MTEEIISGAESTNTPSADNTPAGAADTTSTNTLTGEFNFRDHLSDGYKDKFTEFKSVDDVMKGYDGLVQKLGTNPIVRPGENASDEDRAAYRETLYKELGRPDSVDGYEISLGENVPDGFLDENLLGEIKSIAHREGVSAQGLEALVNKYTETQVAKFNEMQGQQQATVEQGTEVLKQKWGENYEQKLGEVRQFYQNYMGDVGPEAIEKYGNDPHFIDMVSKLADKTKSDSAKMVSASDRANGIRDDHAEMQTLQMSEAYSNMMHADHQKTRDRVSELAARITQMGSVG